MLTLVAVIYRVVPIAGYLFFVKQKTADEMRISDWSSDVCSSDLRLGHAACEGKAHAVEHHFLAITVVQRRDRRRSHGLGNDIEQPCRADEGWKRSKIVGV